jgi:Outer membrane protein beta-barrel domain
MRRAALAILAVISTVLPAASQAKGPPPNYVELKVGGYFPMAHDVSGLDTGFAGELTLGRALDRGFSIEGSLGSYQAKGNVDGFAGTVDRKLRLVPLTFSLKGTAPFGAFEPYALVGVGVYFVRDELSAAMVSGGASGSDSSTNLGLHVGVGGTYLTPAGVFFGLEGKYVIVRASTFQEKTRLDGAVVTADVGFRF